MTTTATTAKPKKTREFKALVAELGSKDLAAIAWNAVHPDNPVKVKATEAAPAEAPLTSQEMAEVLFAKQGLIRVRGRVYGNSDLIEAQVRVLKTGKPEVVRIPGEHHIKAVVVWRTDDGAALAMQNLGEPN